MRKTKHFYEVCARLKRHVGASSDTPASPSRSSTPLSVRELPTAAQDLYKLERIGRDPDLRGIAFVERENEWVHRIRQEVHSKAQQMLARGLETQNQVEVMAALQVFANLRTLDDTVKQSLAIIEEKMASSIHGVLDF